MTDRRRDILRLAIAFDAVGVVPSELRPEAFKSERDRNLWRSVIEAWGKRQRGDAA